jgi:hypothetical protein
MNKRMNETSELQSKASDIIYVAAILTRESQMTLYDAVDKIIPIPQEWKKFCHHMTIRFKPKESDRLPVFGESIALVVTEIFSDEKGIAVKVEPNSNKANLNMPANQVPHITVATSPGTQPVYSNELIKKTGLKPQNHIILPAFIGAKLKHGPLMPDRKDAALENF